MSAVGIIFSDIHDWSVAEMSVNRTVASIPYGGRYRLVDFALSNMVNSGIFKVAMITKSNYQSLMDHVGSGKEWDLSRKNGGLMIYPPYSVGESEGLYKGRLDALKRMKSFLQNSYEEHVVMSDCDMLCNIDLNDVISYHESVGADITTVYKEGLLTEDRKTHSIVYKLDEEGRVRRVLAKTAQEGYECIGLNIWVMRRDYLLYLISDAISYGYKHFSEDLLVNRCGEMRLMGYGFKGYYAHIDSLKSYIKYNLDMIDQEKRRSLFSRPVYTKIRDLAPTKYAEGVRVENSLIAEGCEIEGHVQNSIIFDGVRISRGSVVRNSIVMHNSIIDNQSVLNWVVADKNVIVRDRKVLSADESYPMYIRKGAMI